MRLEDWEFLLGGMCQPDRRHSKSEDWSHGLAQYADWMEEAGDEEAAAGARYAFARGKRPYGECGTYWWFLLDTGLFSNSFEDDKPLLERLLKYEDSGEQMFVTRDTLTELFRVLGVCLQEE